MAENKAPLWTRNFILITVINFFLFCGFQMHPAALPPYVKSLGAPDEILGWVTGIVVASTLLVRPFAGLALDRLGRRAFFLLGMTVMALANLALYCLPLISAVLIIRFVHGLGWGTAGTASNTIAADYIPKARFGEGMGWFSLSSSLSLAIGPALALSLAPGPMFLTSGGLAALAILLALRLDYKAPAPRNAPAKFAPYEKNAAMPAVLIGLVNVTYGALVTFLAVYAAEKGIHNIGPFFVVYALSMVATRPFLGRLIDRKGFRVVVLPGLACIAAALLLLAKADSLAFFLACAVLYSVGQGALQTSAQTLAVLSSPKDRIGAANATFFTGFDAGIGAGAVLSGILAARFGYSHMFLLMLGFPCLSAVLFLRALKRRPSSATETKPGAATEPVMPEPAGPEPRD